MSFRSGRLICHSERSEESEVARCGPRTRFLALGMTCAEIEFHFLEANFCDRKPQDRLLGLRTTQTITPAPKCAYKRSGRD